MMEYHYFSIEVNGNKIYVYKTIVQIYLELIEKNGLCMYEPILDSVRQDIEKLAIKNNLDTFGKLENYLLQQILNYSRANPDEFYLVQAGDGGTF